MASGGRTIMSARWREPGTSTLRETAAASKSPVTEHAQLPLPLRMLILRLLHSCALACLEAAACRPPRDDPPAQVATDRQGT